MSIPTPNWFATFVLLFWPIVALCLYYARPVNQATLWTILGAGLVLPVDAAIKFEGIPQFDKISIPNLAALIGCLLVARTPLRFWSRFGFPEVLLLMSIIGPFITSELNHDPVFIGNRVLPAETHYDALSAVVAQLIFLLPFFLGRQLLRSSADSAEILRALVIAGLIYSLPILIEVQMSPQLHYWVYGYSQHQFAQTMREGGYRPMVFMSHGLVLTFFIMTTAVAAAALWRTRAVLLRLPPAGILAYLSAMLILCKSVAALAYGSALVPLVLFTKPRFQLLIAMVLVSIALLYPMLRTMGLFPTRPLINIAVSFSDDRTQSLEYRFDNEDQLLERASHRFLFGWGRWSRNRVFDPESGKDLSVTDGRWIITIGVFGLFGFLAEFGLLAFPVFRAASALKYARSMNDKVNLAALGLIVAINLVDLLPNSSVTPWTWLLVGALLGRAEYLHTLANQRIGIEQYATVGRQERFAQSIKRRSSLSRQSPGGRI
jgi:hypothetical protein